MYLLFIFIFLNLEKLVSESDIRTAEKSKRHNQQNDGYIIAVWVANQENTLTLPKMMV